jgi:Rad3-related DNA helicase
VEENCVRDYEDEGGLVLKPVRVDGIAERYLWRHCDRALLMSATASPISELADSLGLAEGEYGTVEIGSPFAVENRPIYVRPTADMSSKPEGSEPEVELAKMIAGIEEVLGGAEGNVLVHTNSYRLTKQLRDGVRDPRGRPALAYYTSRNRQQVLRIFTNTGGVLYAPSLERGIDLPDDHCRTIIIAKVPYPYLGDRQTSARLNSYAGRLWYTCQTVRTIVQQCGRGVRHQDDWAVTWVLDSQMMKMLKSNNRPLFPRWWDEAVEIV